MRLLLAAHRNEAPGIGTVVRGLSRSLPDALQPGDELLVISDSPAPPLGGPARVRWRQKPAGLEGRYRRFAYEQCAIPAFARSVDLVHMGDCRPLLFSERPHIVTVHDLFFLDFPAWFPPAIRQFKTAMLKTVIMKRPTALICVSEYTRSRLFAHVPSARNLDVNVIYPGIEPPTNAAAWEPDAPYFLTLSEISPRKNLLTLLRAFQLARRRGLELRWKVAGPFGFRSQSLIEALKSVDGVDVLGRVPSDLREALYKHASFMASPSHAEGFGLPPLEAMIRGLPTICSRGTAMDETLGTAAMRVDAEDVEAWTEGLLRLALEDNLRAELIDAGQRQAEQFTMERMARAHVEVYRSAVARQGALSAPPSAA
jgi:glycosyltransferase involved in cell wall biosynthesis